MASFDDFCACGDDCLLKSYTGSNEEKIIKQHFQKLCQYTSPEFFNPVIEDCNGLRAGSFTQAYVFFKYCLMYEEALAKKSTVFEDVNYALTFKQLFKCDIFESVYLEGLKSVPDKYKPALNVLLNFLHAKSFHEDAICQAKGKSNTTESNITAVLVQHLFSQLVPGHRYIVDSRSEKLGSRCPCECGENFEQGNTALGSCFTWHGYADVFVNQSVAVALVEENDEEQRSGSIKDEDNEPPTEKKRKTDNGINICIEKKKNETLMNAHTVDQIVAESITNAFSQLCRNESLSGLFIPTIGCTSEYLIVFMYDPVNDILLQSYPLIPLFYGSDSPMLDEMSVIKIWILLNFTLFVKQDLANQIFLNKSKFHTLAKNKLEYYKNMGLNQSLSFTEGDTKIENALDFAFKKASLPKEIEPE